MHVPSRKPSGRMTVTRHRALGKLTQDWQTARELGEAILTLDGLVEYGYAECKRDLTMDSDIRDLASYRLKEK